MYSIIPLAGPDFYNSQYGIKPLFEVDGEALIKKIINSRNWKSEVDEIIFVLKTSDYSNDFKLYLGKEFPAAKIVEISDFTKGALMSCLAATSIISDFNKPIACDLADIFFNLEKGFSISKTFKNHQEIAAILPIFESDNIAYSYADIDQNGYVLQTKEKKGWDFGKTKNKTGNASAGVYFFKNLEVFLCAAANSVKNFDSDNHNGNLFVCPSINGVLQQHKALSIKAFDVNSISVLLKNI